MSPQPAPQSRVSEAQRAALEFLEAFDNLDWDKFRRAIAVDATMFMPFPHMARRLNGKDEILSAFRAFFDEVRQKADGVPGSARGLAGHGTSGPPYLKLQPADMKVQLIDNVAIVTFHLTSDATLSRRTIVFHRRNGRWLVAHWHASNI